MKYSFDKDILVVDWLTAGQMPQPFEHDHKNNVVLFENRVELRQFENLGLGKYAVHTEKIESPAGEVIDADKFYQVFYRAIKVDPTDVRKSIRWALKGSCSIR